MPRATESNSLVFESNESEYLSTGDQYGINQIEPTVLPQPGDLPCIDLPELFLINTQSCICNLSAMGINLFKHQIGTFTANTA